MAGKRNTQVAITTHLLQSVALQRFFYGCTNHAAITDFKLCLAQGRLVQALNLPACLLPHALLLHAVAPEPGVVDDCAALVTLLEEEYNNQHRGPRFWHPEGHLVSGLVYGISSPRDLQQCPDAQYLYGVYQQLTGPHALAALQVPKLPLVKGKYKDGDYAALADFIMVRAK